ncbi:uncharacterized protein LOC107707335 [Sinocyclocheilus rhinocerous]|uniref:uncharacterized protein LOC107707335 n=1 Tax=Sinocyclocheilus rhinocerous TaxID=307959 RepID=UPI0007B9B7B1|nr:PREDICTED: uncharacterized protein LOC107707335 [Sinocyclocheilus rhinocerous]
MAHYFPTVSDRLELDSQTGSLTITNIMTSDAGLYKLKIFNSPSSEKIFNVTVHDFEKKTVPVRERETVTLCTGVVQNPDDLTWYFNDTLIAEINGLPNKICADVECKDRDVRFRDRLTLNNQTGALTITNIRTIDSGVYQLKINSSRFSIIKSFSVTVFGFLGVSTDKVSVSVMEGDSVTLHTAVKENQQGRIKWYFNDIRIAQITGDLSFICVDIQCNEGTERFRDRLKLDHQSGSLTIMNTRTTDSGVYQLEIFSNSSSSGNIFNVTLHGVSAVETNEVKMNSVKQGKFIVLDTGVHGGYGGNESHLWVILAYVGKKERGFLLDVPVLPSELFETSFETVVEKFREAKARSAAFKSFVPRRPRSEPEQTQGSWPVSI